MLGNQPQKLRENSEKARKLQIEKNIKEKEAKRLALDKVKISTLIEKHRPSTLDMPDEVNFLGTGNSADTYGTEETKKVQPSYKKATKPNQIKSSNNKGTKPNTNTTDPLLGDLIGKMKKNAKKPKVTEPLTKVNEDNI